MPRKNKKIPGAVGATTGDIQNFNSHPITPNYGFCKGHLSGSTVRLLRVRAIKKRFCLTQAQINWLSEHAYGGPANDR